MNKIHEQEDLLNEDWKQSCSLEEQEKFCFDGLCRNGEITSDGYNACIGNEEELWNSSKRKIVFLMKDTNGNNDSDYRDWPWRKINYTFFANIFRWLEGLSKVTKDYLPSWDNGGYTPDYCKVVMTYPLAIVNCKKISGGSRVYNNTVWNYAVRDQRFLRKQIRDILAPNIIVCGGGSGTMLRIAKELIYPEYQDTFIEFSPTVHYSQKANVLLLDSYHPSAPISDDIKIYGLIEELHNFLKETEPDFMK
jgi:hypothetical protein